jgi:hypothetical protein
VNLWNGNDVLDISSRKRVIRKILKIAGFAGFLEWGNPYSVSDEEIIARTSNLPLVRIKPNGLGNGAYDPGGWHGYGDPC